MRGAARFLKIILRCSGKDHAKFRNSHRRVNSQSEGPSLTSSPRGGIADHILDLLENQMDESNQIAEMAHRYREWAFLLLTFPLTFYQMAGDSSGFSWYWVIAGCCLVLALSLLYFSYVIQRISDMLREDIKPLIKELKKYLDEMNKRAISQ